MRKVVPFALLTAALLAAPGCTTALKEVAGTALGAKGTFTPIQPLAAGKDERPLGQYERFELGPIQDGIGGNVPGSFFTYLPAEFAEQLRGKKLPDRPGGKTLEVRGTITHYEASGTLGVVLGPLEEIIVRTQLVDKDTGSVLGEANCVGRTTERVNMGIKQKAEGFAKAVVGWIDSRYPKEGR
ncbi:MAG TPA: hypothetical protein VM695_10960 [Phycisphaerae bacterium]|nr:hypothetical protein [Phycisphaerae bacterium]